MIQKTKSERVFHSTKTPSVWRGGAFKLFLATALFALLITLCITPAAAHDASGHPEIGDVEWVGIDSLDNITQSGYYYLTDNITLTSQWWPTQRLEITLCLDGHWIKHTNGGNIIALNGDTTLNLYDCNTTARHYFDVNEDGLWILNDSNTTSKYNVIGGVFTNGGGSDGAIWTQGTFNMYGGNIVGNKGVGVTVTATYYSDNISSFNMYGGEIKGNVNTGSDGGGVYIVRGENVLPEKSVFNMYGGSIKQNKASDGGGVYVQKGVFNMYGGNIQDNEASYFGAGVNVRGGLLREGIGYFNMYGGNIKQNKADGNGGGINGDSSIIFIEGGNITNNYAEWDGGGIYGGAECDVYLYGGNVKDNTGGEFAEKPVGVYVCDHFMISGDAFTDGVYLATGTEITVVPPFNSTIRNINGTALEIGTSVVSMSVVDEKTPASSVGHQFKLKNSSRYLVPNEADTKLIVSTTSVDYLTPEMVSFTNQNATYTGELLNAGVVVKDGGNTLVLDRDYVVENTTATAAGTHNVKVKGKGGYAGVVSKEWTIVKAVPTTSDVVMEPAEPVFDYTGWECYVDVNPAENIFGLGDITVKYDGVEGYEGAPSEPGTYKITIAIDEGDNYTATTTDIELGNLIINKLKEITPNFPPVTKREDGSVEIPTRDKEHYVYVELSEDGHNVTITDPISCVELDVTFAEQQEEKSEYLEGHASNVVARYPMMSLVTPAELEEKLGAAKYQLNLSLSELTTALPTINMTVREEVRDKLSEDSGLDLTLFIEAVGANAESINQYIDGMEITFFVPKEWCDEKNNVCWVHVESDGSVINSQKIETSGAEVVVIDDVTYYRIVVSGNGFSGYGIACQSGDVDDITPEMVSFTITEPIYNGELIDVGVVVKKGGETLVLDRDYTVENATATAAGTYNVKVTGIGQYSGSVSKEWTIAKAAPTPENFVVNPTLPVESPYDGMEHNVTVALADNVFGMGEYSVKYINSAIEGVEKPIAVDSYQVVLDIAEGTNYTEQAVFLGYMNITNKLIPMPELVEAIFTYDGMEHEVTAKESEFSQYYKLTSETNGTVAGVYFANATLIDPESTAWEVEGSTTVDDLMLPWVINPKSVEGLNVTIFQESKDYTGKVVETKTTVYDGEEPLELNDYEVIGDTANATAGVHEFKVTGKNNYTGEIDATWTLNPKAFSESAEVIITPNNIEYTGNVIEPTFVAFDGGEESLWPNDYDVIGDTRNASVGVHEVKVIGKNNYTGEIAGNWTIKELPSVNPEMPVPTKDEETGNTTISITPEDNISVEKSDDNRTIVLVDGSSDVIQKIIFNEPQDNATSFEGSVSQVIVEYPEKLATANESVGGTVNYSMELNFGDTVTNILPTINTAIVDEALENATKENLELAAMITASGDLDGINANLTTGSITIQFTVPLSWYNSMKGGVKAFHLTNNGFDTNVKCTPGVTNPDGTITIEVTGSSFSSYGIVGKKEADKPVNPPSGGSGSSGSSTWATTTPTPTPTQTVTPTPTATPTDTAPTVQPTSTQPTSGAKSPMPVLGLIIGGLAAVAVMRRK